jgi:D-alanyl-D-alanine carboxypeptidase
MRLLRTGLAALLAALAVSAPSAAQPAAAPTRKADLHELARGLVAAGAPGAVVFVRTPSGVRSAASGFASLQPRIRMQAGDRYRIASVTKPFVATVVLQLVSEGRLRLEDSVERRLPGLVPNGAAITVRELLNHTSGLFNYTDDEVWLNAILLDPGRHWSPRELVRAAVSHPPYFAPGTNWAYSNTNYVLLGLIIEAVTGRKLDQELSERLFGPLALRSTSFPTAIAIEGRFAHGYISLQGSPLIDITPALSPTWAYAAGEMVSNAADVTTFFSALLKGRLLPAAQLAAMKSGSTVSGTYGLGLRITLTRCGRAFGHDGDFPGWRNVVWATPNGRRVAVVMVNVDESHVPWSKLQAATRTALCSG